LSEDDDRLAQRNDLSASGLTTRRRAKLGDLPAKLGDFVFQLHHHPDALEIEALGGKLGDAPQTGDVGFGVATVPARRASGIDEATTFATEMTYTVSCLERFPAMSPTPLSDLSD